MHLSITAIASFTPMPESAWWPRFWALAHILVNACDRDLDQIVGRPNVRMVEEALAQISATSMSASKCSSCTQSRSSPDSRQAK